MIDVIYFSRGTGYGIEAVKKFINSYKLHPAGCEHKLTIVTNAWNIKCQDYKKLLQLAKEVNAQVMQLPDDGFDFGAYYRAAKKVKSELIFCMVTSSEILHDNWLKKFEDKFKSNKNLKLAGTSGSWEICPNAYNFLLGECERNGYGKLQRFIKMLPYKYLIDKQRKKPLRFPNYHVRSTDFCIDRNLYIKFMAQSIMPRHKVEAYNLESGHDSMTNFITNLGYEVGVIGADGKLYYKEDWDKSRTFRCNDISNALTRNKQYSVFEFSSNDQKKAAMKAAWGTTEGAENCKIFVIYNKPNKIFESDIFLPIQTNCNNSKYDLNIVKDNQGDNISDKNEFYAELTAQYWVWKNYIQNHQSLKYIGFCQYRRFLDFFREPKTHTPFNKIDEKRFEQKFETEYSYDAIYSIIKDYDLIIARKFEFYETFSIFNTIIEQYEKVGHPIKELRDFVDIIKTKHHDYIKDIDDFLNGKSMYMGTVFIIKKELYLEYISWIFPMLFELEKKNNWSQYKNTYNVKIPAFLFERFFNVWLNHKNKTTKLKILERDGWLLTPTDTKKLTYNKNECIKLDDRKEKFTFAMPVYNGIPYIRDAVESIINQEYQNWELYILENCSTDETAEYLKTLDDQRIKILYSEKQLSMEENWARINELPLADYLCITGHDDTYCYDYLTSILEEIQKHPHCNIYRTNVNLMDNCGNIFHCSTIKEKITIYDYLEGRLQHTYTETGAGYCIKSSRYKELGGIDCKFKLMSMDDKLVMEAIGENNYMAVSPYHSANYRCHTSSVSGSPNPEVSLGGFNYWLNWIYNLNDKELRLIVKKYLPLFMIPMAQFFKPEIIKEYKKIYKLYGIHEYDPYHIFLLFKFKYIPNKIKAYLHKLCLLVYIKL